MSTETPTTPANAEPIRLRRRVLILQHPQEPREALSTVPLLAAASPDVTVKVGLSWANLKAALGDEAAQPSRWAILYLGSGVQGELPADAGALVLVDKGGKPLADQRSLRADLDGIIVLDGTWSQAKALWWRNPWVLKCRRAILRPAKPSLYGKLRREPRRECVSTLEAVAEALVALGEPESTREALVAPMRAMVSERTRR